MKTLINILNLNKVITAAACSAFLYLSSYAQPSPVTLPAYTEAVVRLEQVMNSAEQSLRYSVPELDIKGNTACQTAEDEVYAAIQNLNLFSEKNEKALRYMAPDEVTEGALQDLDLLAESTINLLKYNAPAEDEEVQTRLNELALGNKKSSGPVKEEIYNSPQDIWLIQAGYFKSNRTPAWEKIKQLFQGSTGDNALAEEL